MSDATFEGLVKKTAEMNATFNAADDAGKRVIIAQDVIAALKAKKLRAEAGVYLKVDHEYGQDALDMFKLRPEGSFQEALATLPPCQVCAKGAIFVCVVARRNQVSNKVAFRPYSLWSGSDMQPLLGGLFGADQLALIEREFEGAAQDDIEDMPVMGLFDRDDEDCDPVPLFDDETRMVKIMENIVKHGGTFVPGAP